MRAPLLVATIAFAASAATVLASAGLSAAQRGAASDIIVTVGPALGLIVAAVGCAVLDRAWGRYVLGIGLLLHLVVPIPSFRGEWSLLTGANSSFAMLGGGALVRQAGEAIALVTLLASAPRASWLRVGSTLGALGMALAGGAVAWLWLHFGIAGRLTWLVIVADALMVVGFVALALSPLPKREPQT